MNLATKLDRYFSSSIKARGLQDFLQHRVFISYSSDFEVEAQVKGTYLHDVNLYWTGGRLIVWCDCNDFMGRYVPCQHLWAVIQTADAKGYLPEVASATEVTLDMDDFFEEIHEHVGGRVSPASLRVLENTVLKKRETVSMPSLKTAMWKKRISEISRADTNDTHSPNAWPAKREILYIVSVSGDGVSAVLSLESRDQKKNGDWSSPRTLALKSFSISQLPLPEDREILSALIGGKQYLGYYYNTYDQGTSSFLLSPILARTLLPRVVRTGRCYLPHAKGGEGMVALGWDDGPPWAFDLELCRRGTGGWTLGGFFHRGDGRIDVSEPMQVTSGGFLFMPDRVVPHTEEASFTWVQHLRRERSIEVPEEDLDAFLTELLGSPLLPPIQMPEELQYEETKPRPRPSLRIFKQQFYGEAERLNAELSFDYEGRLVLEKTAAQGFYDASTRRLVRRDCEAEKAACELLDEVGVKYPASTWGRDLVRRLGPTKLPRVVRTLVEDGWHVEAEGKLFRRPGEFHLAVSSGVDWFELHGDVEYGESKAELPALLEALRRGNNMVLLDDGSYGMLPEEWLRRIGPIAGMGTLKDGQVRFRQSQAGLLDAMLATQLQVDCDATFTHLREELRRFNGVEAAEQPAGFVGQLREYQREGLGWMHFLRRFRFGGCLADDMGVGKTAQVLALLESRRELRVQDELVGPSLVVVPKSLIFNWKQEAARFTPQLRILDYTGLSRNGMDPASYDLVLTTYGTLRRDILRLQEVAFDYVILDESQAVKNANTESAKAVRLLRGANRLALSGTPIENHLGELWSLFEFLNPGMLGAASVMQLANGVLRNPDEDTRKLLASALRPFLLRRTKEQVARELPAKYEQTIYCEMEPAQHKLYDELRQHYRNSLLRRIQDEGMGKSKIQVLEALLRLRQAACHPGLLDPKHLGASSAKLDVLLEQLRVVLDEGHKALVFSQFTSLLAIVRQRLERIGVTYEYLDGKTHNRQARVVHFQEDPACQLFLISLKAGGLGLNLTAADYVFILDPWWNPAVESQAVDRAHRIGQTRQVFAYRLITRDTVEEKVLELQETKRDLADAIIGADNGLIRNLRSDDLELLLS
jgi:superfamily II DNA or RNA helicase